MFQPSHPRNNWKFCQGRSGPGITLIEATLALALVLIFSGGVVWSYRLMERRMLQNASIQLQADLRYAQRMALIEGRRFGVLFDMERNRYYIMQKQPDKIIKTISLANGVYLVESSASDMVYLPRGTGSHGFRCTLGKGPYQQRLTATVSGGRVQIYEITVTGG